MTERFKRQSQRTPRTGDLVDVACQIEQERREFLLQARAALNAGDDDRLKFYVRKLCGLQDEDHHHE